MNLFEIFFSPTGGTQRISQQLIRGTGMNSIPVDLCARTIEAPALSASDLCFVSVPSFAGRVPSLAAERLLKISGCGAMAVAVVSYGNRAYDDTLLELRNLLSGQGFRVIAAVAAVAEHSIFRQYAAGRPDADDVRELNEYGRKIIDAARSGIVPAELPVPGSVPHRPLPSGGVKPAVKADCSLCGACAADCPAGAIPADRPDTLNAELCISCMRCVSVCPSRSRYLDPAVLEALNQRIGPALGGHKSNELYI